MDSENQIALILLIIGLIMVVFARPIGRFFYSGFKFRAEIFSIDFISKYFVKKGVEFVIKSVRVGGTAAICTGLLSIVGFLKFLFTEEPVAQRLAPSELMMPLSES